MLHSYAYLICLNNPVTLAVDWFFLTCIEFVDTDAPKDTRAEISPSSIKERQTVTLTCSAKGHPEPTFAWFKNEDIMFSEAQWNIISIADSQSGTYSCEAQNKHGTTKSQPVVIDVLCESFLCFTWINLIWCIFWFSVVLTVIILPYLFLTICCFC